MKKRISLAFAAITAFGFSAAQADVTPLTVEDFSKFPAVSSVSMSMEGDMLVGVVNDPTKEAGQARAAAYWDLSGEIDTSKPLIPSNITPSTGKAKFFAAAALKNKKAL